MLEGELVKKLVCRGGRRRGRDEIFGERNVKYMNEVSNKRKKVKHKAGRRNKARRSSFPSCIFFILSPLRAAFASSRFFS